MNITFNTAKLAKEKGFNGYVTWFYFKSIAFTIGTLIGDGVDGSTVYYDDDTMNSTLRYWQANNNPDYYAAPSQYELQLWLRVIHNLHSHICYLPDVQVWNLDWYDLTKYNGLITLPFTIQAETYEEVLELGLYEGLQLIK